MVESRLRVRSFGLCYHSFFSQPPKGTPSQWDEVHHMLGVTTKLRNVCFSKKQLLASWNALTNAEGVLSSGLYLFLIVSLILITE